MITGYPNGRNLFLTASLLGQFRQRLGKLPRAGIDNEFFVGRRNLLHKSSRRVQSVALHRQRAVIFLCKFDHLFIVGLGGCVNQGFRVSDNRKGFFHGDGIFADQYRREAGLSGHGLHCIFKCVGIAGIVFYSDHVDGNRLADPFKDQPVHLVDLGFQLRSRKGVGNLDRITGGMVEGFVMAEQNNLVAQFTLIAVFPDLHELDGRRRRSSQGLLRFL